MRERSSPRQRERPNQDSSPGVEAPGAERASAASSWTKPDAGGDSATPGPGDAVSPATTTQAPSHAPARCGHPFPRPRTGAGDHGRRLLALDEEVGAAVLRPALLRLLGAERALLAVAERAHAGPRDATVEEVLQRGLRAMVAEGEVVFVGAPVVAVAFDQDDGARVVPQPLGVRRQELSVLGPDHVFVEVEVDVLEPGDAAELLGLRAHGRDYRPRPALRHARGPGPPAAPRQARPRGSAAASGEIRAPTAAHVLCPAAGAHDPATAATDDDAALPSALVRIAGAGARRTTGRRRKRHHRRGLLRAPGGEENEHRGGDDCRVELPCISTHACPLPPCSLTQADVAALAIIVLGPLQKFTAEVHQHETLRAPSGRHTHRLVVGHSIRPPEHGNPVCQFVAPWSACPAGDGGAPQDPLVDRRPRYPDRETGVQTLEKARSRSWSPWASSSSVMASEPRKRTTFFLAPALTR